MASTENLRRGIDHLTIGQYVVIAHVETLLIRTWVVEHAHEIVDQVINGDAAHLLLAAHANGDRLLGLARNHSKTTSTRANDHTGPDESRIKAAIEQELFRPPALTQPFTRCILDHLAA